MTGSTAPRVFESRTVLGDLAVDRVSLRTASADAHHVAKVHGRYGVAGGLEARVTGGRVEVSAGEAFTPRGDFVVLRQVALVDPPATPGRYRLWLGPDARVTARPATGSARPSDVPLGLLRAAAVPSGAHATVEWVPPVSHEGRSLLPAPVRPHIGAGRELLTLDDLQVDEWRHTLERRVRTADAGFARPPLYVVSVSLSDGAAITVRHEVRGWFTMICRTPSTSFTLTLFLHITAAAFRTLRDGSRSARDGTGRAVLLDVSWVGVDTRREQDTPADLADCSDKPPIPPPVIG